MAEIYNVVVTETIGKINGLLRVDFLTDPAG
jgi:hypothetical protein